MVHYNNNCIVKRNLFFDLSLSVLHTYFILCCHRERAGERLHFQQYNFKSVLNELSIVYARISACAVTYYYYCIIVFRTQSIREERPAKYYDYRDRVQRVRFARCDNVCLQNCCKFAIQSGRNLRYALYAFRFFFF